MLKRLLRSRSLRIVWAAAAAGALLGAPQPTGAQTPAPAVSSITVVSSPEDSVSYQPGETIEFSVQFTATVRVSGSPTLAVDVGDTERSALFESVRGSEALFAYSVIGDDIDPDGVSVGASALTLGSGDAITDSLGGVADLAHDAVPADAAHRVNMSVVTIEAAGTEPVTEDRSATYIVRRTGSLSRALTVDLDHLLDDNLDNADPAEYSGELPYVHSFRIPRTVTFQSGQDSVRLEIPLNNDAEIEVADGSLTMIVAESADYLVGRPDAATRILQDDNDVPIRVSSARSLGTTVEGPRRLETSLTLQSTRPRDKPPDQLDLSISTRSLTAVVPIAEGHSLLDARTGDYVARAKQIRLEPSDWYRSEFLVLEGEEFMSWKADISLSTELIDDNVPEPLEQFQFQLERAPATPAGIFASTLLPHISIVTILDDDLAWEIEVLHVDGDTAVGLGEGQTIDTFEDGDESGDLVLDLVATSLYPVGSTAIHSDIHVEMELVGDTEEGLEATYLTDFRRRDESSGTLSTQTVVLSGADITTLEGGRRQTRKRVSIRTVDDTLVEGTEDFRIRLSKTFPDAYVTFTASQFDVRILDNDAPAVSIAADAGSIAEGDDVTFTLTRPAANSTEALPVTLSIVESAEYIDRSGGFVVPTTLTFAAGESTVAVTVPTQDDHVPDGDGTIVATLQPGDGYSYTAVGRSASVDVLEDLPELTLTGVTVSENRSGSVAVSLSQASDEAVSFRWTTADRQGDRAATGGASAGSGVDYRSGSATVEIAAGVTSATIPVRAFNDAIDEHTETFDVVLSNIVGAAAAYPRATVSIRDTDDPPQIKVENGTCPNLDDPTDTDTACTEGDDGHMNFDVWLRVARNQGTSGKEVSVGWTASDYAETANTGTAGKARAGSDYVAGSGTLTFPPGVGRLTVQVELLDDEIGENTERFSFRLDDLVNAAQYDSFAYGEILDDGDTGAEEPDTEAPTLSVTDVSVAEGVGTAKVQVQMSRAADRDVSVDYSTADEAPTPSAEAGKDYTATSGTATITAGALSTLIDIPITQDLIYETDETFTVTLSSPVDALLSSDSTATVTILDDDRRPALSVRDTSADEESGPLRFTVERIGASSVAVSANWATADGTAISPADYTGATGTVTIGPDETTATISVTLAPDDIDESDESLHVTLSNPAEGTIGRGTATGTIFDNDEAGGGATPRLVVAPTAVSVAEGDSAGASYTVRLASAPSGDVTVTVSGASGSDLTVSPAALEFTTGNWDTARTVTVTAGHDDDHTNDTVTLTNTAAGGGYSGASPVAVAVTVADDDSPELVISPTSVTVDEGDTSGLDAGETYTVRLATQPSANVAVTITGTAGTDVSLDTSSMTFTANDWDTAQTVRVTAGHDDDADDDEVTLVHTAAGGGYSSVRGTVAVTVDDDDTARGAGLLIDPTSVEMPEGGGSTYTVRLATEPAQDVAVTVTGTDADLTVLSVQPTVLTFTAADWDTPQTVALAAGTDADTDDDQMTLTHTAASDDTAYDGLSATLAVKVIDDGSTDHAGLEVNPTQLSVDEGGATGYNVRLRSQPSGDVTVTVAGAAGSDLEGVPDTLTFTDVDWGVWQSVAMIAHHDPDIDNDAATLTHTAAGGSYGGQSADVTVTIVDDDTAGVSLAPTRVTVTEGGGSTTYTAVLDSQPSGDVTVTIGGAGSEVSLDETSLVFTSGNWNTPQTVTVTAVDDTIDEDTETVTLTHTAASTDDDYDGLAESLRVDVVDDDTAGVVAPAAVTVTEGEAGVGYPVRLATKPTADVTVTIGGVPHDDITLDKTTLTFTSGNWDTPQTVTVTADDDDAVEDTETVTLPHRTASDDDDYDDVAVVAITTVTVRDNDDPPVQVSFGASSYSVVEGETVFVSVVLSAAAESEVEVSFTRTDQGGATGVDYSTLQRLTFGSGDTSKTFPFVAVPDDHVDRGESVLLGFDTLPPGFTEGSPDEATVSITDAADAPAVSVSFGASSYSVAEGSSVTVTVELSADPGRDVVVPLTHDGQNGAGDSDYSGVPESVTFASGDTSETFTLTAASDSVDDDGESVLLGFGSELPTGFTAGDEATVSITDDPADVPSVEVSFGAPSYSVAEGETETVTVELDVAPEREVVVPITVANQGGAGLADYSLSATSVTFAANETTVTFTFSAVQDGDDDDGESVLLGFEALLPDGVSEGSPEEATVTIVDDDDPWVELFFEQASYSVDEDRSVEVTVRLSADPERTVKVPITAAHQGGASSGDYSLSPTSVTFAATETSKTFTFTAASDSVDDDGESVVLGFGARPSKVTVPGTTARPDEATVSIGDDDDPAVEVFFEPDAYSVAEGSVVAVKVRLDVAPERLVTVPITVANQGDTSAADYAGAPTIVVFAGNETEQSFSFSAPDDTVDDDGESVVLGFGELPDRVSAPDTTARPASATVSITDDDTAPTAITLTVSPTSVSESASGTTVTVTATLGGSVTLPGATDVVVSVGGGSAISGTDYAAVSDFTVTIPKETASGTGTFTLTPTQDAVAEGDETIDVTGTAGGFTVTKAQVTLTDDETAPTSITLTVSPTSVSESASGTTVTVTATLGGSVTLPGATDVVVSVGGGSATSGTDYAAVSGFTVTIPKETVSGTGTFTLTPTQDAIAEDDETIDVTGAAGGFTVTKAQMTLTDDETAPTAITLTVSPTSVSESASGTTVTVTATLDGSATRPGATDVVVSVGGGTATSGTDYAAVSDFTVTIPKQTASGTGTFTLAPTNDSLAEGDETIDVTGAAGGFTVTKAEMTLTDDETAPASITLTVSPTSVGEDDGATTVTVTATLDGSVTLPGATEVTVSVGGGSATSGTDYAAVSDFTVTIPKETASGTGTFTLTPTNDSLAEGDETIDVTGAAGGFTVTKAQMTLIDDETAPASITLTVSPTSVSESASGTTVTVTATLGGSVTLPGATEVVVSVGGGSATSGTDYAAVSDFTVTIPKESASGTGTFTLAPTNDDIAEGDETIDVTGAADGFTVTKAQVTLTDDETAPTAITLTVSPASVGEDDGATTVTVTATLGGSATLLTATAVTVSVGGGTATSGTDYAAVSDFTVTIPKETASGTGTFTLTPTNDDIAEGDETIDVTGTADGFTVTKAQVTLTDDDTAPTAITLTVSPTSVGEDDGATTVTVTATLGGSATLLTATEVTVSVGGGTATSGTDYAAVSDFTVTIPKETASGTGTFTLTPTNDDIAEGDETIDVTGAADGFTVTKAEVTLTDDETAPASITLTVSPTSVSESASGTTVTVTAMLGGSATRPGATEVVVSVGGGSATSGTDYAAVSDFTVTIPKETASGTGTFTLTPTNDSLAEGDETIDVTGTADGFTVTKAQMTLTDDETAPASITLTVSPTSVSESASGTTVTVTAMLGGSATRPGATEVVVSVGGGSATSGTDYAAVSDFTVTIPKETASGTGTFTLTPTNDSLAEGDETIDVTGTADGFTVTKAQMTLTDDETAPTAITLTTSPTSVSESASGTTVTVTATLDGSATRPGATEVVVSVGGGTATSGTDYAAVSDFTVTIPKQTASGTGTFTLTPTQDAIAEGDETIDVTGTAGGFTVTKAQMTLTDDETAPTAITLTTSPTSVSESASGTTVTVTATLDGSATRPGATEVVVSVGGGSATSGTDYAAVSDFTVTIPKQTASGTGTFTLTPTQDAIAEGDETIDVTGTAGGFTVTKAQMTLIDDETAPTSITLTTSPTSVGEDDGATTVTVTATLDGSATRPGATEVVVSVGGGSATSGTDYTAVSDFTVTIPKQTASGTGTFTLTPTQDAIAEGDETIDVTGTADGFTVTKAEMTLIDDETAPTSITLTTSPTSVGEDDGATTVTVTATLDGSATRPGATEVVVSVGGGSATSGTDYAAVSDFTVTIPKQTASGSGTFTLTPTNDSLAEGDETIDVTGTADGFTVTKAQMTLTDDETAPTAITLTTSPTSVSESASGTTVTVTATLDGSATRPGATEVVVSVGGGSATSGTDYTAVSDFTVTIPKQTASGTGTFTLTPTNDAIAEGDETIDVTGTADGFTVTKAQMTLIDDETAPASITLTTSPTSVGEDDGATTVTVTATLDGSATRPGATEVVVSVGGGSATSGTDYAAVSDFTVTIPKQTASGTGTFTLTPTNDAIAEGDETIDVTGAADGFTVTKAEMTLTDDETAPTAITLTVSPASVGEDDGATTVTVTATLGGSVTLPGATEVVVSVGGGTAISGTDYAAVSDFTVTIPKETASGTGTFTLTPTQDAIAEGDETIDVTGAADGFTVTKAEMTLTDDETAPTAITLTVSPASVGEDDGATTVTVTATLGGSVTLPGATEVVVSVGGGSATSGTDYAAVSDFTVTIPKETASGSGTFTLTPTNDSLAEGDETIDVTGAAGGFTVTKAEMTLTDDDPSVTVEFEKAEHLTREGASRAGVALTLSAAPQAETRIEIRVESGSTASTSDYLISTVPGYEADDDDYFPLGAGETFEVTFAKDATLASFGVKPIPDLLDEGEEQIVFGFGTLPSGIGEGSLSKATVTILDSDREEDDGDDDDGDDDDGDDDDGDDRVCQRGVDGEAMFEVSAESRHVPRDRTMPRVMIAEGDNGRGIAGEQATLTVSTVAGATCSRDQTFTLDLAGTAVLGHDYSISPRTLTLPAGETSVSAAVTARDDGDDLEPTETVEITVRHQGEKIGQETVWISPCDGAGRGWAFSWLTVEEMRRAHRRPSNVTSPFTLRVCFSEPVNHVRIINDEYDEYLASLIIASHEVRPPNEARRPYVTGTLSNLREIQLGQIWLVDVTADETGYFALTLLGSRYQTLDGNRDNYYSNQYSYLWVTVS